METKKFKCKDEVIYRRTDEESEWTYGIFSHYYDNNNVEGVVVDGHFLLSTVHNILPYEGNEHLVGRVDEPDEEVRLEYGELIIAIDKEDYECGFSDGIIGKVVKFKNKFIERNGKWGFSIPGGCNSLAIRFSDFNPNDMEETKKHILCVNGGKVVKYKG